MSLKNIIIVILFIIAVIPSVIVILDDIVARIRFKNKKLYKKLEQAKELEDKMNNLINLARMNGKSTLGLITYLKLLYRYYKKHHKYIAAFRIKRLYKKIVNKYGRKEEVK